MAKDRYAVTCNGRTAFYACMYEDIRQCAMDCGWAVSLHGSLASDMDIMAMPWVDNAVSFKEMVDRVSKLFKDNDMSSQYVITHNEKPHNRVVATIPIYADFYLDISTINTADVVPKSDVDKLKADVEVWRQNRFNIFQRLECYKMARQKVAREIFEEIEALNNRIYNRYVFEDNDYSEDDVAVECAMNYGTDIAHDIEKLKKKYMERAE